MNDILNALGEQDEIGGQRRPRIVLPRSYYALTINVEDVGVTDVGDEPLTEDGNVGGPEIFVGDVDSEGSAVCVKKGGSPFVAITAEVADGPFGELDPPAYFRTRFWLTPGKGPYIAVVQKATRALTGAPFDQAAMDEAGFEFSNTGDKELSQQEFRYQYLALGPQERLDLMAKLVRVGEWDQKVAICRVGDEKREIPDDDSPTGFVNVTFNRIHGWYAVKDKKFGAEQIRAKFYGEQEKALVELGLAEAA